MKETNSLERSSRNLPGIKSLTRQEVSRRGLNTPSDGKDLEDQLSRGRLAIGDKLSYLKTLGRDGGSSSRRELIDSSRKLLFTNIQIMDKK